LSAVACLVVALALYPLWTDSYGVANMRDVLLFALFALSLDFLWGKAGILSFGHATFFGLGAYGMAVATVDLAPPPGVASLLGLGMGIGSALLVALLVGYFLIFGGVRGPYLSIVTLALGQIAQSIAIGWSSVTGGDSGLLGVPPLSFAIGRLRIGLEDPTAFYYVVLVLSGLVLLALWASCQGHYGRVLAAIGDNELRAQTLGHNTSLHLFVIFLVSAGIAATAGAIYATAAGFVAPDIIGLLFSTQAIVWVAVGGRGTLLGPFIGTFVVWQLQQQVSSMSTTLWPLVIGTFFIFMVFLFPDGVLTLINRVRALIVGRRPRTSSGLL
jgi:branched-chain amino acid transport system permease protein